MHPRLHYFFAACLVAGAANAADPPAPGEGCLRIATYNVAMYRDRPGQLSDELEVGESAQAKRIAEVLQRVRPDVLLINEIDFDPLRDPPRLFAELYAARPQAEGLKPLAYTHRFAAPVNTGVPSGLDLDADGSSDGPADAWGYGRYSGQYGMAVLSRLPIDERASRTFQKLKWSELPDARRPIDPRTGAPFYEDDVWRALRLPSKTLMDVVIVSGKKRLHLICSHPTPPVFDGPEDRNGARNADEIRLVREYVTGGLPEYFIDDQGAQGALKPDQLFVVLGDLNADPFDGDGLQPAIRRLIGVTTQVAPESQGGGEASSRFGELNHGQLGDPSQDTGAFGPDGHGNLRIDYALPCPALPIAQCGVYWPRKGEPGAEAVTASDHRLVWIDVVMP